MNGIGWSFRKRNIPDLVESTDGKSSYGLVGGSDVESRLVSVLPKRHYFFLLDHMVLSLRPEFREGVTETILDLGLKHDADDMEVIDLAWRRHAILVSVDGKIIQKCKTCQDRSRSCLYGLLMLPDGGEIQKRLLGDLRQGTRQMRHARYDKPLTWADVHDDNLLVRVHKGGDPDIEELSNCAWEEE
jgi:hypothetical protein